VATFAVCADVVSTPDGPLIDGAVLVRGQRIAAVGRKTDILGARTARVMLGRTVLAPGLVNAHTHLALGDLADLRPRRPGFGSWVRRIASAGPSITPRQIRRSLRAGAAACIASGTTAVGDIVPWHAVAAARATPLAGIRFVEVLGFARRGADLELPRLRVGDGLAPHAPYSTSDDLYRHCASLGRRRALPLALHVAESEDELDFVRSGRGPLRTLLDELGLIPCDWRPPRCTPVQHLTALGAFDVRANAIHASFASRADLAELERRSVAIVTCPRSNLALTGRTLDVPSAVRRGLTVALGTDSLASCPSLSLLDEMRALSAAHPSLTAETILHMATAAGADALSLEAGTLTVGKRADLAAFPLGSPDHSPAESILAAPKARWVAIAGVIQRGRRPR